MSGCVKYSFERHDLFLASDLGTPRWGTKTSEAYHQQNSITTHEELLAKMDRDFGFDL